VNSHILRFDSTYFRFALQLAVITIIYNLLEGLISVYFGYEDETLTLFGFGMDSFIETISAAGILNMTLRIQKNEPGNRNKFEIQALKITGWCFYTLSVLLAAGAIFNIMENRNPETTIAGVIIAVISIISMWLLIYAKRNVGRKLKSDAIIADANCNLVCLYMSFVLLLSSLLFELTGIGLLDALGAAGLIWFSVKEGREAFDKARGADCGCVQE
jgi:divalent metal cation (Fe/Co/Zn/Cd) transporter